MKILFLSPLAGMGGAERCLVDLLEVLPSMRPDVSCDLLSLEDGPLMETARVLRVPASVVPFARSLNGLGEGNFGLAGLLRGALHLPDVSRAARFISRHLAATRPDVIHSNGIKTHLLSSLLAKRGTPVIWHIHEFLGSRRLTPFLLRLARSGCTKAVCNSSAVATDARDCLPAARTKVIYNGVDCDRLKAGPRDTARLDRLAGLPAAEPDVVRVGLVGTYAKWKGHELFLDAIANYGTLPGAARARFYIVGGSIYRTGGSQISREDLIERARSLGIGNKIGFIDFQSDPSPIYQSLDIVVHAATSPEPFGRVIVEAMACERAVIATLAGGALELFTPEKDSLGVAKGDAADLSRAMARLAGDPALRARLGRAGRENVLARFDRKRYAREFLALYDSCLQSEHKNSSPKREAA